MTVKLEAVVHHKKHDPIGRKNVEKYIFETLKSKIDNKFPEVCAIGLNIIEGGHISIAVVVASGVTKVKLGVIKNHLKRLMKNLSKRFNTNCHVC